MTTELEIKTFSNEPHEFLLTPENFLDTLMEWLPDYLHKMRSFQAGNITIKLPFGALVCAYTNTVGGEKFRIYYDTALGASASFYFSPLGADDDVIVEFAMRIDRTFQQMHKMEKFNKQRTTKSLVMRLTPQLF